MAGFFIDSIVQVQVAYKNGCIGNCVQINNSIITVSRATCLKIV
jgi:hypothetical protein